MLEKAIEDLIVQENVSMFYVGNQGQFDAYVRRTLCKLAAKYPDISYAVVLAYMPQQASEQRDLLETMESEDCTPSLSQAQQLKHLSQAGQLDMDRIFEILREPKANQQEKISFRVDDLRKFFPKSYSAARIQETILKLLSDYQRKRQRAMER